MLGSEQGKRGRSLNRGLRIGKARAVAPSPLRPIFYSRRRETSSPQVYNHPFRSLICGRFVGKSVHLCNPSAMPGNTDLVTLQLVTFRFAPPLTLSHLGNESRTEIRITLPTSRRRARRRSHDGAGVKPVAALMAARGKRASGLGPH